MDLTMIIIWIACRRFWGIFTYLGKNTEKYITFTVPIEKEGIRISKNGEKITKAIS